MKTNSSTAQTHSPPPTAPQAHYSPSQNEVTPTPCSELDETEIDVVAILSQLSATAERTAACQSKGDNIDEDLHGNENGELSDSDMSEDDGSDVPSDNEFKDSDTVPEDPLSVPVHLDQMDTLPGCTPDSHTTLRSFPIFSNGPAEEAVRPLSAATPNAVQLFPLRADAAEANYIELTRLSGPEQTYTACDTSRNFSDTALKNWLNRCQAPQILALRVGARVMLLKSAGPFLPQGSVGKVIGAASYALWDQLRQACKRAKKAPTLIIIGTGIRRKFGPRPVYWPVVHFTTATQHIYAVVCLHEWRVEHGAIGQIFASRMQIPLVLAWAMTIHRSQGLTFPAARVNLTHAFECGQAYVGLSRVRCADNLQVIGITRSKILTDPLPLGFYGLQDVELDDEDV
ncbi:hypothetical protein CF319_g6149 [Tilletia indica]|nr:hypothetical protein CF319_g6149 [Tilletia indica]